MSLDQGCFREAIGEPLRWQIQLPTLESRPSAHHHRATFGPAIDQTTADAVGLRNGGRSDISS